MRVPHLKAAVCKHPHVAAYDKRGGRGIRGQVLIFGLVVEGHRPNVGGENLKLK